MKQMESLLISVVMPFYNVAPYFKEAVESVLEQTYPHWELLLADDGSTDGSDEIAKEYEKRYPFNIRYLCHPGRKHLGTVASRMLAIQEARGNYLAFLDADDCWLPEKLGFQKNIIMQYPEAGMICGATKYWFSWLGGGKKDEILPVGCQQDVLISPPDAAIALYPLGNGAAPCLCSIVVKKEAALKYKGLDKYFSEKYQLYEDQAFLIKVYLSFPVFVSSKAMDTYRQRSDSNMHSLTGAGYYHEVRYYFLKWLRKYLKEEGIKDQPVWEKLKEVILPYKYPLRYKIKRKLNL